ncbi:MAG: hypothetical protein KC414_14735 [Romboutsia sp.]|nr:hypothetical protein [Romboutsia sp.]
MGIAIGVRHPDTKIKTKVKYDGFGGVLSAANRLYHYLRQISTFETVSAFIETRGFMFDSNPEYDIYDNCTLETGQIIKKSFDYIKVNDVVPHKYVIGSPDYWIGYINTDMDAISFEALLKLSL